jgi:tape measure domain-containing protein
MAEDIYSVRLEDEVSGPAAKAAAQFTRVAVTAAALASTMRSADKEQIAFARDAHSLAGAELRAARAAITAGAAVERLTGKTRAQSVASRKAEADTKGFSYALNGLATGAANAGFNLAGKLARGLVDVAAGLWETAELASRSRMSLGLLYGGMAEGQAAQSKALELSRKYGLSLETVLSTMNQFKSAGFSMDQSSALLQLGADMRALGSTDAQLDSVFLALRKIQSQGFLQGDELNMLSEAGVSVDKIYSRLEDKLGKTREQIIKMQGARQLLAGDVLNAIAEATLITAGQANFGKAGEKAANETLGGIKSRLFSNLGADLFEATQRAEPALVKGMQAILSGALGADGKTLQDQLTNGLVSIGRGLESLGPKIPGFIDGLGRLAGVLERLIPLLENAFAAPANKYQSSLPGASLGMDNTQGLGKFLATKPGALAEIIADFYGSFFKAGNMAGQGVADGMTEKAPTVAAAASGVAQGAVDSTKDTLQIKSPSRVMAEQGGFVAEGLAMGIEDQADIAMRASSVMAEGVVSESAGVLAPSAVASAAGSAAGDSYSSSVASTSNRPVIHFDVHLGAGGDPQGDAVAQLRDFVEIEMAAIFERHLEGAGA